MSPMEDATFDSDASPYHAESTVGEAQDTCEAETTPVFRRQTSSAGRRLSMMAQASSLQPTLKRTPR